MTWCGWPPTSVASLSPLFPWWMPTANGSKLSSGWTSQKTSRDAAFCAHTILQSDLFIVQDTLTDPRFVANPLVTGDPSVRFYAGAPLVTADGYALGSLCVIDQVPRELTPAQQETLRALGDASRAPR